MLLSITTGQRRWCAMVSEALPARSLRGRPASLRTFPERACYHLPKPLIWRVLLAIRSAISGPKRFFSLLSGRRRIPGVAPAQQDLLLAGEDKLAVLVVDGGGEGDHTGRALRRQRRYLEHRIEGVSGMNRLQEFRGLLDKGDQRVADSVGKGAGPRCGEIEDLEAVRQRPLVPAPAAILDIVMDRVIIGRDRLEG